MSSRKVGVALAIGGGVLAAVGIGLYVRQRKASGGAAGLGDALGRSSKPPPVISRRKNGDLTVDIYSDRDMPIHMRVGIIQDLVRDGLKRGDVRELAQAIIGQGRRTVRVGKYDITVQGANCAAVDKPCKADAIGRWTAANVRYSGDVAPVKQGRNGPLEPIDYFSTAKRIVEIGGEDCLPSGTLLLTEGHRMVPIELIVPGTKIWGLDGWTNVEDVWSKGVLPVDVVFLNNGSSFKATSDHKVYVSICRHEQSSRETEFRRCTQNCGVDQRETIRLHLSDLREGMVMVTPERIPFGQEAQDPEMALLDGLYLSDGWSDSGPRFSISGQDGCPKEAQKRVVEEICDKRGLHTYWNRKYIRISSAELSQRMAMMGHRAPQKHALSIDLNEDSAAALLRGIMADSGASGGSPRGRGRTLTTTSRELFMQARLLNKMFGVRCSEYYIVDHGGLGQNPIWRLGVPQPEGRKIAFKALRVKAIARDVMSLPVWDITTSDHYVYLPEADVTVSNCDGHAALNCTLLEEANVRCRHRITAARPGSDWGHIYTMAEAGNQLLALDTTLPGYQTGRQARHARKIDFAAVRSDS